MVIFASPGSDQIMMKNEDFESIFYFKVNHVVVSMRAFRVYVVLLVFSLNQKMLSRSSGADKNGRNQNQDQLKQHSRLSICE